MSGIEHVWIINVSWWEGYPMKVKGAPPGGSVMMTALPFMRTDFAAARVAAEAKVGEVAALHRAAMDIEAVIHKITRDEETKREIGRDLVWTQTMTGGFAPGQRVDPRQGTVF